ncbi:MAG TPA: hypothetical protein VGH27_25030 [Streptosporangiaceae bacterium]|jgi:hypothetical protein
MPNYKALVATAGATVLTAGLTLASLTGVAAATPGSAATARPASVPAYYVGLAYSPKLGSAQPGPVTVKATKTGQVLATIAPPSGEEFTAVSGAANDRTFVLAADTTAEVAYRIKHAPTQTGLAAVAAPESLYLMHLSAAGVPSQPTPLGIPSTPAITDFTLSPDGTSLAVSTATQDNTAVSVRSLANGSVRTWTTSTYRGGKYTYIAAVADSWAADGMLGTSVVAVHPAAGVYGLLDTTKPGGNLISSITTIPDRCGNLITPDGKLLIGAVTSKGQLPWLLQECSYLHGHATVTGPAQQLRWGKYRVSLNEILWTSPTGNTMIAAAINYPALFKSVTGVLTGNIIKALPDSSAISFLTIFPGNAVAW